MGQKYAAYNSQGAIVAFYDSADSPPPQGAVTLEITDAQWMECLTNPGYTVESSALVSPVAPTAAELLATAKTAQLAVLSAACGAAIVAGFTSSALGAAHSYPSKVTDQQNLNASVTASMIPGDAANWTTLFWCADSTGNWSWTSHTAAQIQQVGKDGMSAILALQSKNAGLAAQVAEATTVAAVQAIVWE